MHADELQQIEFWLASHRHTYPRSKATMRTNDRRKPTTYSPRVCLPKHTIFAFFSLSLVETTDKIENKHNWEWPMCDSHRHQMVAQKMKQQQRKLCSQNKCVKINLIVCCRHCCPCVLFVSFSLFHFFYSDGFAIYARTSWIRTFFSFQFVYILHSFE